MDKKVPSEKDVEVDKKLSKNTWKEVKKVVQNFYQKNYWLRGQKKG